MNAGTDVITATVSTGNICSYQAVVFTGSTPTGITAGTTYWLSFVSNTTFKVYSDCYLVNLVDITSTTTGATFASVDIGRPKYIEKNYGYILDVNGRCWSPVGISPGSATASVGTIAFYTFMGNTTLTGASGNGLCVFKSTSGQAYLFIFRDDKIDYTAVTDPLGGSPGSIAWTYGWQSLWSSSGSGNPHQALVSIDNVLYYTDGPYIGSIEEKVNQNFNPSSSSTYTWTQKALALPIIDTAQCIEMLGTYLMIGGRFNLIYPWDRLSAFFKTPIVCADKSIQSMVTVNNNLYFICGYRGRIFVSNGANAELYVKVPDNISGTSDPTMTLYGISYYKNQLYFGAQYGTTGSPVGTQYSGLWSIDIDTKALRVSLVPSTTTATPIAISGYSLSPTGVQTDAGVIYGWWDYTNTTYGIDVSLTSPTASYYSLIDTDIIPVGQFLTKRTFEQVEWKTSKPLVAQESIKISYRTNLNDSFTLIKEWTYDNSVDVGNFNEVNFENVEWLQLRYEAKSKVSSPSFVRLREIRIR